MDGEKEGLHSRRPGQILAAAPPTHPTAPPHPQLYGYAAGSGPDATLDRFNWRACITIRPGLPHTVDVEGALQLRLGARGGAAASGVRVCVRDKFRDREKIKAKGNVCLVHGQKAPKDWTIEVP